MISSVRAALDSILGSAGVLQSASGAGRLFELFIMTGIAMRLQQRGLDVWLQRSDGSRILPTDSDRRFVQRGGAPAGIPAASAGRGNASVIGFRKGNSGSRWEIWNGIQFRGRSGATHEIDIALVPAEVGDALRLIGGVPFGRPRAAVECKDVGRPASVDEMRALVARLYDLTIIRGHRQYVPYPPPLQAIYPGNFAGHPFHGAKFTYRDENFNTLNVIARRTGFSSGSAAMTVYYAIEPHDRITVGSARADALVNAVVDWIVGSCP